MKPFTRLELQKMVTEFVERGNKIEVLSDRPQFDLVKKRFERLESLQKRLPKKARQVQWAQKTLFAGIREDGEIPISI